MIKRQQQELPATNRLRSRWPALPLALVVLVLGGLTVFALAGRYRGYLLQGEKARVQAQRRSYSHQLGESVARRVALLQGLSAFVLQRLQNGAVETTAFADYAHHLVAGIPGIRSIAIAPGGTVNAVYPRAGNAIVPGHDLLHDLPPPDRLTIQQETTGGRINLDSSRIRHGGSTDLVARLPVYGRNGFWGLVAMDIDFNVILAEADLAKMPAGLLLALRSKDGSLLFGSPQVYAAEPVTGKVYLTDGVWELAAAPAGGWSERIGGRLTLFKAVGLLLALGLALITYLISSHEVTLAGEVRRRTTELDAELAHRRRSEQQLQREHRTLQAFLDALPESAMLLTPEGRVLACNRIARQRLGVEPEEDERNNLFQALPPEVALDRKQIIDEVVKTGRSVRFVDERFGRTIANHFHPVCGESEDELLVALIALDISERMEMEGQLRQVQKLEAIGTLSGGVAHEFNNILTAIIGQASLAEMKLPEEEPLLLHIRQILGAAERGERLTKALLAFSRRQRSNPTAIDLNIIVYNLDQMLGPLLGRNIRMALSLAAEELVVSIDASSIEQVLLNLALNARDAMPGGGEIHISTERTFLDHGFVEARGGHSPGHYARLLFRDTGEGMDKTKISRIFEPFFTTREVGRGTGLGLSVAFGIVQQNQGFLTCDSTPGKGTTFDLCFPLVATGRQG